MILLLKTSNTKLLRELFRRISQHSSKTIIEKKQDKIKISSIDNDEKSYVSALLKENFFINWSSSFEVFLEVDSKNLYNLSKIIPEHSEIYMHIFQEKIKVIITKDYVKEVIITGKNIAKPLSYVSNSNVKSSFIIKSELFQNIIKDINSFTDEASITLDEISNQIIFKVKERQMDAIFKLDEKDVKQLSDVSTINFPIKFVNYFSSILKEFNQLEVSISKGNPMIVRGQSEQWEFLLMLTNIIED